MTIFYPDGLPLGLLADNSYQLVSPLQRSDLESGRARQRRRFTSVPEQRSISWLFTPAEARAFIAWFRDSLVDGSLWFECRLLTTMGLETYQVRFIDVYQGPRAVGPTLWSISANVELVERAAMPPEWGLFPEFIIDAAIIDAALNIKWPMAIAVPPLLTEDGEELLTEDGELLTLEQ